MRFSTADALTVARILRDGALAEIMPRFRALTEDAIREKSSPLDLVTDADESAERFITARLKEAFPHATVFGEETVEKNKALLTTIAEPELLFILDPVDGTANFASGLPLFGVMASVISKGEVIAGIIYDPLGQDWAIALRGEGAWFESLDGKRRDMRVAKPAPLSAMVGGVSWGYIEEPLRSTLCGNMAKLAAGVSLRCAAHEYRLVASGHTHFVLFNKLMPWDHAAGWLLHQEAGGYSALFNGAPYTPMTLSGGLLCAPDKDSWMALEAGLLHPR
jgi:fructose-1,6-bisphosphatase/inositol monophosphatase family enzyme